MKIKNQEVFERIVNLLYAIAMDQHVKPIEIGELKLLISEDWLPRPATGFRILSKESHQILLAIDSLLAEKASAADSYLKFATFYLLNEEIFNHELRTKIFNTAAHIVKLFEVNDAAENPHFESLKKMLRIDQPANISQ
jgi:hypothetical protein